MSGPKGNDSHCHEKSHEKVFHERKQIHFGKQLKSLGGRWELAEDGGRCREHEHVALAEEHVLRR